MPVRSWPRRFVGAVVCVAVGIGLVGAALASGTWVWDASRLESRPPPSSGPLAPSAPTVPPSTAPPSTYPVVPARPGGPRARYLQPVYALPSDATAVPGRSEAILHEIGEVTAWFRTQLDGAYPRYARDGQAPSVVHVELPWSGHELATVKKRFDDLPSWLHEQGRIETDAIPVVYVEATTDKDACGWTSVGPDVRRLFDERNVSLDILPGLRAELERFEALDRVVIPLQRCPEEDPSVSSRWPDGGTSLLAHETTHALGAVDPKAPHYTAVGHTNDDPRDILYVGPGEGTADRYVIDAGHDDYYRHGRPGVVDIADSELLVHPSAPDHGAR